MKTAWLFLLVGFFSGLAVPRIWPGKFGDFGRRPASASDTEAYQELPCPSETQFRTWLAALKFDGNLEGQLCDFSRKGKLARTLSLLDRLKLSVPAKWLGGARDALSGSLSYVARNTTVMRLDLSQKSTVAYNRGGEIHVGGLFFESGPVDSASTLVHEARHSAASDPRHVKCLQGDIPWSAGGCDERFRADDRAGAYAYEVSWSYALAAYYPALTKGQKEYLLGNAFFTLAHRFNITPPELALVSDEVVLLDDSGALFLLDAWEGTLHPLRGSAPALQRIRKGTRNHSLWGFSGTKVFTRADIRADQEMKEYFSAGGFPPVEVLDLSRLSYDSGEQQKVATYYLSRSNELHFSEYQPDTGKYLFKRSSCQPGALRVRELVHARGLRYLLGADGGAYYCDSDEKGTRVERSGFQKEGGWRQLDGGVFFADLFGVSRTDARIYLWDSEAKQAKRSAFDPGAAVIRYREGIGMRMALLEGNRIAVRSWDGKQNRVFSVGHSGKIIDMEILRRPLPEARFMTGVSEGIDGDLKAFAEQCGLRMPIRGLHPGEFLGVGAGGRIFRGARDEACRELELGRFAVDAAAITQISLRGAVSLKDWESLQDVSLQITHSGEKVTRIRPYFFAR